MKKQLEQLREFHQAVTDKTGSWLSRVNQEFDAGEATAELRAKLIEEEADEAAMALREEDKAQVLKELCDLLYVALGTAVTFNLPLEQAFDLVHENNMLKIQTGKLGKNGKWEKHPQHPKVNLQTLLDHKQKEICSNG